MGGALVARPAADRVPEHGEVAPGPARVEVEARDLRDEGLLEGGLPRAHRGEPEQAKVRIDEEPDDAACLEELGQPLEEALGIAGHPAPLEQIGGGLAEDPLVLAEPGGVAVVEPHEARPVRQELVAIVRGGGGVPVRVRVELGRHSECPPAMTPAPMAVTFHSASSSFVSRRYCHIRPYSRTSTQG